MRNVYFFLVIAALIVFPFISSAQYITPGNNLNLTLDELVNTSSGVVTFVDGAYQINSAFTLSATDTLRIDQEAIVRIASGIRPQIYGTIISDPESGYVHFTAIDTTSSSKNYKGFRFDDSPSNVFRNTIFTYGGGIQLIGTEALFEYCTFRKNGSSNVSAVITYSSCSPIIRYCSFIENARAAIGSGANVNGSPRIMYNVFIHNTTDNSNRPQINLGPGAADSIYIVGNYIEGFYTRAGGIGISNLMAIGSTKVVVRDNYVINNRFGYTQIGVNIFGHIVDNYFIDNNIENSPALGGSGVNFLTSGEGNTAIVKRNVIKGNLWGATIQGNANPQFGTEDDPGENVFYENGNSGITYALYNNTPLNVTAIGNYWGTNDPNVAEDYIFHKPDDATLGLVTYMPIKTLEPKILTFLFSASENPQLTLDVYADINHDTHTINATLPPGTDVTVLVPEIVVELGIITDPTGGQPTDFRLPVEYNVTTPHGDVAVYTVTVDVQPWDLKVTFIVLDEENNPIGDAVITFNGVTNVAGDYQFAGLSPGDYDYTVELDGFITQTGQVEIIDQDVTVTVVLEEIGQLVELKEGWSMISSYLVPEDNDLTVIFAKQTLAGNMVIMLNNAGIFWPGQNINTLKTWNPYIGYKLKMTEDDFVNFKGLEVVDKTINLNKGINYLPVLTNAAIESAVIFEQLDGQLILAFDINNNLIYWPEGGINTLLTLEPGSAYLLNLVGPASLTYPDVIDGKIKTTKLPAITTANPWSIVKTGAYHIISIYETALTGFAAEDIIGAFSSKGQCVGMVQKSDQTGNLGLVLYGNDFTTDEVDGLMQNEEIHFKVYRVATGEIEEIVPVWDNTKPNEGLFVEYGLSAISQFKAEMTSVTITDKYNFSLYPNPAAESVNIVGSFPKSVRAFIVEPTGRIVNQIELNGNFTKVDISQLKSGIYLIQLFDGDQLLFTEKMLVP